MGSAVGNFIMSPFCLIDDKRYLRDSDDDRLAVWISFMISFAFQVLIMTAVFLIPNQKQQAREWKVKCQKQDSAKSWNAAIFVTLCVIGLIGSSILNLMTMFESTRCYMIAGGPGCDIDVTNPTAACILYS